MKKSVFLWMLLIVLLACGTAFADSKLGLTVDGEPVNGTVVIDLSRQTAASLGADEPVVWTSSYKSRGSVDEDGTLTFLNSGSFYVTARSEAGVKERVTFSVVRKALSISITGPDTIASGTSATLKAAVLPTNANNRQVTWKSDNPDVLTVNAYGRITAKRGLTEVTTVKVTATAKDGSGIVAEYPVTVYPIASSVTLTRDGEVVNGKTLNVDIYDTPTLQLTSAIGPDAAMQDVVWTSSYKARATVENGLVTGLKKGNVTITATAQDGSRVRAYCRINFTVLAKSITISGPTSVNAGSGITLKTTVLPTDTANKGVTWSCDNPNVATVNAYGHVTAKKGLSEITTVHITATAKDGSGVVAEYPVTVYPIASTLTLTLDGEVVNGKVINVDLTDTPTLLLSSAIQPAAASQDVVWTSSSKTRATVLDGLVTGHSKGSVTITAAAQDGSRVRASCVINFTILSKNIEITGPTTVTTGKTVTLKAAVTPENTVNKNVTWSSSNPSAASVNRYGVVTGGNVPCATPVTITATANDGGAKADYVITVMPIPQSIQLSFANGEALPGALLMDSSVPGSTLSLKADVFPADASQTVTWGSSNTRVVTVDANGTLTVKGSGMATITVKSKDNSRVLCTIPVAAGSFSDMPYYVEIDRSNQVVRIYERGDGSYTKLVRRMICSTGSPRTNFKNGLYRLPGSRNKLARAESPQYYMPYATKIEGPFFFHGVPTMGAHVDRVIRSYYNKLGNPVSAGCIRLINADARWIYENLPAGTFVLFMQGVRNEAEYGSVTIPPMQGGSSSYYWDPTDNNPGNPEYNDQYTSEVRSYVH